MQGGDKMTKKAKDTGKQLANGLKSLSEQARERLATFIEGFAAGYEASKGARKNEMLDFPSGAPVQGEARHSLLIH